MKNSGKDLFIEKIKVDILETPTQRQKYNQLIFIKSGKGVFTKSKASIDFSGGDFILIRNRFDYSFSIMEGTKAYLIKFSEEKKLILKEMGEKLEDRISPVYKAKTAVSVSLPAEDQKVVIQIFELLISLQNAFPQYEEIANLQIISLMSIMERNANYNRALEAPLLRKNISLILHHIHKNLENPHRLKLDFIAKEFHMSVSNLSLYFKKEMDETLASYIDRRRMRNIEHLVKNTDYTFSQIAFQYGFSDESHFYKRFKKCFQLSPSDYRMKR